MNKQELIEAIKNEPYEKGIFVDTIKFNRNWLLRKIEKLDEPEAGHADEAPRYVKNILARLRELPLHDREVWLNAIMGEFEKNFSHAKWREGYEQGKFEGMVRREKVKVPQFVADWIEECKENLAIGLYTAMNPDFLKQWNKSDELISWSKKTRNQELFARAWLDGYTVEKEKRYLVKIKGLLQERCYLNYNLGGVWLIYNQDNFDGYRAHHTRKELEDAGFGWVFDCPGIEIEEVEDE